MTEFLAIVAGLIVFGFVKDLVKRSLLGPETTYLCDQCGIIAHIQTKNPEIVRRFISTHENSHGGPASVARP